MPKVAKSKSRSVPGAMAIAGAYFMLFGVVQFIAVMVIVQVAWPCNSSGCYNILTNPISDLGNTALSPLWPLFNYSLVIFGAFLLVGLVLLGRAFAGTRMGHAGVVLLLISALGAAGVGVVPENTILAIHSIFALIAFILGGLGVLLIGMGVAEEKGMGTYSGYSILSGIVTLLASSIILLSQYGILPALAFHGNAIGFGAVERLTAGPVLLWVLVTGLLKRR